MLDYDLRNHLPDARMLASDYAQRMRVGAIHNLKTDGSIMMDVANYSSIDFIVTAYDPNHGQVSQSPQRLRLDSLKTFAAHVQEAVIGPMNWRYPKPPFFSDYGRFVLDHFGEMGHSYVQLGVNTYGWSGTFGTKQEIAMHLTPLLGGDPNIVLMIKKYAGGDFNAGISMSTGSWLHNAGFLPIQDACGTGIIDHILDVHTGLCKLSTGTPAGSEIAVTCAGIKVTVKAENWSSFVIDDA
ncbi:MAG: hypothetical protein AAF752_08115 [Bacteroidota bacterium]